MKHAVEVRGLPAFVDAARLLGVGDRRSSDGVWRAVLETRDAADLGARLRGLGLGGGALEVVIEPALPRAAVRAARTEDARRRRDTTPGFLRPGARLDAEGRISLTPEALALAIAGLAPPGEVFDLGAGAGGNAIAFARRGWEVSAVERDPARLETAQHNARLYGVEARVRWVRADAVEWLDTQPVRPETLLFTDPPWGADWDRKRCEINDFPLLVEVLRRAAGRRVWAKLPPSFDPTSLPVPAEVTAVFGEAPGDCQRVKLLLVRTAAA